MLMEVQKEKYVRSNADIMAAYKEENDRYNSFKEGLQLKTYDNKDFKRAVE